MPDQELSREEMALLCKYDSPTVCNVIELFEVRPRDVGYMGAGISERLDIGGQLMAGAVENLAGRELPLAASHPRAFACKAFATIRP